MTFVHDHKIIGTAKLSLLRQPKSAIETNWQGPTRLAWFAIVRTVKKRPVAWPNSVSRHTSAIPPLSPSEAF